MWRPTGTASAQVRPLPDEGPPRIIAVSILPATVLDSPRHTRRRDRNEAPCHRAVRRIGGVTTSFLDRVAPPRKGPTTGGIELTNDFLEQFDSPKPPSSGRPRLVPQAYADGALRNQVRNVETAPEGERNHKLNVAAFELRPYIAGGALDEMLVTDMLTAAARAAGLDEGEIAGTIRSGFAGGDQKGDVVGLEPTQTPSRVSSPSGDGFRPAETDSLGGNGLWGDFPPVDGAEWMFNNDDAPVVIWGQGDDILWADGEALMIAGVLGLGKTTLAGKLVRGQLGLEDYVLGLPILRAERPILYLAMDRPRQIRRSMRRQFTTEDRDRIAGRLIVRQGPPAADIAAQPLLLTRMAEAVGAGTVYIDSLKDAVVGLTADEVAASYNRARQHLLARGINLVELHHMAKRNAQGGPPSGIADVYGSAWLTAGAGSVITLLGEPGDLVIKFKLAKLPADEVGPWKLHHNPEAGELDVVKFDLLMAVTGGGVNGVTARDVAEQMYETRRPTDAECKRAARLLDKQVKKGWLTRIDGHRGGTGGSVPTCWFLATEVFKPAGSTGLF